MTNPTIFQRLSDTADELACRFSNSKIDFLANLGKAVLPNGRWGHHPEHASEHPTVYLTFDDGPSPRTTPALLELLAEHDIQATFFLIGANCKRHPELVKRIHDAGHTLGNHTYHHLLLPTLPTAIIEKEILGVNRLLEELTGVCPTLFRPPFGLMDKRASRVLEDNSMTAVYWGAAPEDWLIPGTHRVVRRVMWRLADGTLIVLHEGPFLGRQTIEAASEIISKSRNLGYQFSKVKARA